MDSFIYTTDLNRYEEILQMRIADCICKHVMDLSSEKAQKVYEESKRIGYEKVMWGIGQGYDKDYERNRYTQLATIQLMIYDNINRPIRIVIDKNGIPWVDNLHTAIKEILLYSETVRLKDVPIYIVDMRTNLPTVVDINNSVEDKISSVLGCVKVSYKKIARISDQLRNIRYTIEDFMKDNDISQKALTLDDSYFEKKEEKMRTKSYVNQWENEIEIGKEYHFGEIWDGDGEERGEMLLEDGIIYVQNETSEMRVEFKVLEKSDDVMETIIEVTDITA